MAKALKTDLRRNIDETTDGPEFFKASPEP